MISLHLTKSSEVTTAGDQSNCALLTFDYIVNKNFFVCRDFEVDFNKESYCKEVGSSKVLPPLPPNNAHWIFPK